MFRRILVLWVLLVLAVAPTSTLADEPDDGPCLPESRCGLSIGREMDVEEILEERQQLKAHLAEHPEDAEPTELLLSNLGSYSVEIHRADGTIVRDGVQDEYRSLLRHLRQLDPDHRNAWCQDLDTSATLDEALELVAREPGHWLVTECLAEYLVNESREDRAIRLLDAYLTASGFVDSLDDPHYEMTLEEATAVTLQVMVAEESSDVWAKLVDLADSTAHVGLRFDLAVRVEFGFEDDDPRKAWAEETFRDLLETDLPPGTLGSLCEWLWFEREDEPAARRCFQRVLGSGPPDSADEDWLFAAFQARESLNEMDLESGFVEPVALRIEQAPAFGRMHLWESFVRGVSEEEMDRACAYLADSWLRGDFENEVLASPETCPRRLDILVNLMTDCGFAEWLRERIGQPDSEATSDSGASTETAESPAASSAGRAVD